MNRKEQLRAAVAMTVSETVGKVFAAGRDHDHMNMAHNNPSLQIKN